jgi:hypothetical protein
MAVWVDNTPTILFGNGAEVGVPMGEYRIHPRTGSVVVSSGAENANWGTEGDSSCSIGLNGSASQLASER